jgi:ABC-type branched-subunit amino acid transport system permease subunit
MVGLPALRLKGIYLAHRHAGLRLHRRGGAGALGKRDRRQRRHAREGAALFGWKLDSAAAFYYLCLGSRCW